MSLIVYADAAQYGNFVQGPIPYDIDVLLRAASFVVARAGNRDPYSDIPADTAVAPLADATCAQVAFWVANGINPNAGGIDTKVKTESKIGSGQVRYDTLSAQQIADATGEACPQTRDILQGAGLLWLPLPVGADPCDPLPTWGINDRFMPAWVWASL